MHRERRAIRRNGSYAPGSSVSVISECENATPKVTSDAVDGRSTLAVQALDMGGVHGAGEPDYTWDVASNQHDSSCAGLAAWDVKGTIVSMEPIVTRDGPEYRTLVAGLYNGVLKVEGGDTPNYNITYISGNLNVTPAVLSNGPRKRRDRHAHDHRLADRGGIVKVHVRWNRTSMTGQPKRQASRLPIAALILRRTTG